MTTPSPDCPTVTAEARQALLSKWTSRQNKLWLATTYKYFDGWFVEWKWQGEHMHSRLCFRFGPDEPFVVAKSYEEDVVPTFKFNREVNT
jgi:hypothetical protein